MISLILKITGIVSLWVFLAFNILFLGSMAAAGAKPASQDTFIVVIYSVIALVTALAIWLVIKTIKAWKKNTANTPKES